MYGYIYVLHYPKLSHAQHYVGATTHLNERLARHAKGTAAALTRELKRIGIRWELATIYTARDRHIWQAEQYIKAQKHTHRYCGICCHTPTPIPNATHYEFDYRHLTELAYEAKDATKCHDTNTSPDAPIDLKDGRARRSLQTSSPKSREKSDTTTAESPEPY